MAGPCLLLCVNLAKIPFLSQPVRNDEYYKTLLIFLMAITFDGFSLQMYRHSLQITGAFCERFNDLKEEK